MAAAQQLTDAGRGVTVYERGDRIGGPLSPAHAEGVNAATRWRWQRFIGDERGRLRALEIAEVKVERDPLR